MTDEPLPTGPITDDELLWLRGRRRDEERAKWLMRLLKRIGFHLVWALGAAWGAYEWFLKHVTIKVGS